MPLYLVRFDSVDYPVEATTMARAIKSWQRHNSGEEGWDGDEEPDQVVHLSDEFVIREVASDA